MRNILGAWIFGSLIVVTNLAAALRNPGFDETPWDTGWTTQEDTSTSIWSNGGASASAIIKADTGRSPPNCCYLETYASAFSPSWSQGNGAGSSSARAGIFQKFNPITNCTLKVWVKYRVETFQYPYCGKSIGECGIRLYINGTWVPFWEIKCDTFYYECVKDTNVWVKIGSVVKESVSGIEFYASSSANASSSRSGCSAHGESYFWIDDVSISEVGAEEEFEDKFEDKGIMLKVYPSPCIQFADIRFRLPDNSKATLTINDICGRTVFKSNIEHPASRIIWDGRDNNGKRLSSGLYFVKLETKNKKVSALKLVLFGMKGK